MTRELLRLVDRMSMASIDPARRAWEEQNFAQCCLASL
jgi:hypothetical protein